MPKTSTDELFQLIQSLTKAERAYFNTISLALAKGTKSKHLKLFTALCKQQTYNEKKIIQQFKPITSNYLSVLKSRLQEMLFKSLANYYANLDVEIEIQEYIHRVKILLQKKMLDMASKFLFKAKRLIIDHEKYDYSMIIFSLEHKILVEEKNIQKIKAYLKHEAETPIKKLDFVKNAIEYQLLALRLNSLINENPNKNLHLVKKISQHPLLSSSKKALTFSSLHSYYYLKIGCSWVLNDRKMFFIQNEWITYLEKDQSKLIDRKLLYLRAINNMILSQNNLNNLKGIEFFYKKGFSFIKSLPAHEKTTIVLSVLEAITANYMHGVLKLKYPGKAIEAWKELKNVSIKKAEALYTNILLQTNLVFAYFLQQQYHEALKLAHKIVNIKTINRLDAQQSVRGIILIIYYELAYYDQLLYLAKSTQNYLIKTNGVISEFDKLILNYFERVLPKINHKKEEKEVLTKMKKQLLGLPLKSIFFYVTDSRLYFFSWLDSKIQNQTMLEVLRENKKQTIE